MNPREKVQYYINSDWYRTKIKDKAFMQSHLKQLNQINGKSVKSHM